jgi:uncharacterized protein (TIGR02246 family)
VDDIEAIKQLKARYFRTMDTKDWDGMRQVFADDVVVDTTASGGAVVTGRDAFMVFLRRMIGDVVTVHHGHTPEIELTSPTTATGIWAMEDMLRWPNGTQLHGYGHYHESYAKIDDQWCITSTTLTRLRVDVRHDDVEAIRAVLVRYATAIDTKDWPLFRTCFTADATTDYGEIGSWADADGITRFMDAAHQGFGATNHMLSNFVIEVDGDWARATTSVHAVLAFADASGWIDSVGRYEDDLVRTPDGWRIARRRAHLTRTLTGS